MSAIGGAVQLAGSAREEAGEACRRLLRRQAPLGTLEQYQSLDGAAFGCRNFDRDIDPACVVSSDGLLLAGQVRVSGWPGFEQGKDDSRSLATLLEAWKRWGWRYLEQLIGDYAIALWSERERTLYLARAPLSAFGLAYRTDGKKAAFATLATAIPDRGELDLRQLVLPLTGRPLFGSAGTAFQNIRLVEPGTVVRITSGTTDVFRLWDPARLEPRNLADGEAADEVRSAFDAALDLCLRDAGSPIASHLSAGRDSGLVTAAAAKRLSVTGDRLVAYTAVPGPEYRREPGRYLYDEGPGAAEVASLYANIDHRLFRPGRFRLCDALDRHNKLLPAPYGTPVNLPWWSGIQAAAAQAGAKVLLTGAAGNLTVSAGGPWAIPDLQRSVGIGAWWSAMRHAAAAPGASWLSLLNLTLGPRVPKAAYQLIQRATGRSSPASSLLFLRGPLRELVSHEVLREDPRPPARFRKALVVALRESDHADPNDAALHGLSLRDPTADRRVVEAILGLSGTQLAAPYDRRPIFERAFADLLPPATLRRSLRGAQSADWNQVICPIELREGVERYSSSATARELVDLEAIRCALGGWPKGVVTNSEMDAHYMGGLLPAISLASYLYIHSD
jgi:asparagine synthase (glutamine-hydrolysing)